MLVLLALAAGSVQLDNRLPDLHRAAVNGEYHLVKELIGEFVQSPHVDRRAGPMKRTALQYASEQGHLPTIKYLLFAGASARAVDAQNMTALHLAALKGYIAPLPVLAKAGADVDAKAAHGMTPLHFAAAQGHVRMVQALVRAGARTGVQNSAGATPLELANDVEVRVLLHPAQEKEKAQPLDCEGNRACIEGSLANIEQEMERLKASAGFDTSPVLQRQHGALYIAKKRQLAAVLKGRIRQITDIEDYDEDHALMRELKALRKAYREHQSEIVPQEGVRKEKPPLQHQRDKITQQQQQQRQQHTEELRR
jgi:hypothetical protein